MRDPDKLVEDMNNALLAVMRAAGSERHASMTAQDLRGDIEAKNESRRLPIVRLPQVSWWQRARLAQFKFPAADDMVAALAQVGRGRAWIDWRHIGAALDVPDMDKALAPHPDTLLARSIDQIVQSAFAPDLYVELETYFMLDGAPGTYDDARALQVYTIYMYLTSPQSKAARINNVVPMTQDIAAMRTAYMAAVALHQEQSAEVAGYRAALDAYARSPSDSAKPDWTDFVRTRA